MHCGVVTPAAIAVALLKMVGRQYMRVVAAGETCWPPAAAVRALLDASGEPHHAGCSALLVAAQRQAQASRVTVGRGGLGKCRYTGRQAGEQSAPDLYKHMLRERRLLRAQRSQ